MAFGKGLLPPLKELAFSNFVTNIVEHTSCSPHQIQLLPILLEISYTPFNEEAISLFVPKVVLEDL